MGQLTFDAATHTYRWDGVRVPHVTQVIAGLVDYSRIQPEALERARQEGVAVHKMVQLYFDSELNVDALPTWMRGHYDALCRFHYDTGFEVWAAEKKLYNPVLHYAGTPDLIGLLPKLKNVRGPANIDVKRSLFGGAAIGLQTAGYTRAWNDTESRDLRVSDRNRFALQLRADGTYRLEPYQDGEDFTAFLACLQQLRWRAKHYPKEKGNGST